MLYSETVSLRVALSLIIAISLCLFIASRIIYRLFFHVLRNFPGPKLWAVSRLPWHFYNIQGTLAWRILSMHQQYGPTIRIAPDELSYTSSQAWKKIYGQSKPEFEKCLDGRGIAPVTPQRHMRGLIAADQDKHTRLRRAIAPAFSDRALREQEQCLQKHSTSLIQHLKTRSRDGSPIDLVKWFNLTTFDIISDLAFGQPEGCLSNADQPWLAVMGARAKSIRWYQLLIYYNIEPLIRKIAPASLTKARMEHMKLIGAKIARRIKEGQKEGTSDFMSYILDNKNEKLSNAELAIMASAFLVAGSGTSARAMSATVYYLVSNPAALSRLTHEIRSTFSSEEDITLQSTTKIPFLRACIDEAMRLHPPQPGSLPRFVPAHGEEIEGKWIPGGVAVGVHQLASGHMLNNFASPEEFVPERWLDDGRTDDRAAVQPFSYGPRGCIGVSLAYAEMRLILAKLLFVFDLEKTDECKDWTTRQKSYVTWEQLPLMIRLRCRE